jgi:hypothetical protein
MAKRGGQSGFYQPSAAVGAVAWRPGFALSRSRTLVEGPQIVDDGPGVVAAKMESWHIGVSGEEAVLEALAKIFVIEFCFAKRTERRSIPMRTASEIGYGMALRAQPFEQRLRVSLLRVQSVSRVAQDNHHENQEPAPVHHSPLFHCEVALPYAWSATSPEVTAVETIRTIRSQSRRFLSALLSVNAVKAAFSANLRIGTSIPSEGPAAGCP